jgi:hypothetical protein
MCSAQCNDILYRQNNTLLIYLLEWKKRTFFSPRSVQTKYEYMEWQQRNKKNQCLLLFFAPHSAIC